MRSRGFIRSNRRSGAFLPFELARTSSEKFLTGHEFSSLRTVPFVAKETVGAVGSVGFECAC